MSRLSMILAALTLGLMLLGIPAQSAAQDVPPTPADLPAVNWPCESRFLLTGGPAQAEELPTVEWPCESRWVLALAAPAEAAAQVEELPTVEWPCESRWVLALAAPAEAAAQVEELPTVEWPCESRWVLALAAPAEAAARAEEMPLLAWPSEKRYAHSFSTAQALDPITAARLAQEGNKLRYGAALEALFAEGNDTLLNEIFPAELAQTRRADWTAMQAAFTDLQASRDFQMAEGDRVLSCWTFRGTHSGTYLGIPASGNDVSFQVLYTARFAEGKVVEEMGGADVGNLMQQLGALPVGQS